MLSYSTLARLRELLLPRRLARSTGGVVSEGSQMTILVFPISEAHVLMFARSIGDLKTVQAIEQQIGASESIAIPPTFLQAFVHYDPAYHNRHSLMAESRPDLTGLRDHTLHAGQTFTFRRSVHIGDILHVSIGEGSRWRKRSSSGDSLEFSERVIAYRDESGDLIAEARSVAVSVGPGSDS
jgi:N-terminal half of MaoC dehydratase